MQQNRHNKQQTFCFDFMHFSNHDHYFLQTCILSQRSHYHSHHCTSANTIDVSYLCLNSFILNLLTSFHLISFYQQSHTFIHPVVFPLFCFIFVFVCVCKHTVITAKTTPAVPLLIPSRSHPIPSNPIQSNPTKPLITIMHLQQHPTQPNHRQGQPRAGHPAAFIHPNTHHQSINHACPTQSNANVHATTTTIHSSPKAKSTMGHPFHAWKTAAASFLLNICLVPTPHPSLYVSLYLSPDR